MVDAGDTAFVKTGPKVWGHVDKASQQIRYRFIHVSVDPDAKAIILFDPTRNTYFSLNFTSNMVRLRLPGSNVYEDFRPIVNASLASQIPGINRDWWQNEQLDVFRAHNGGVTAKTVRMIDMGYAALVKTAQQQWLEVDKATGEPRFDFTETFSQATELQDMVVLVDQSRNISLVFFLMRRDAEIGTADVSQPRQFYRKIEAVSGQSIIPGINRDWWGSPTATNVPPPNTAPPGMAQLTWQFRNETNDVVNIRLKSDRTIWPGNNGALAYNPDGRVYKYVMNCVPNETICLGAWERSGGRRWGLGPTLDTSKSCQHCCQTCRNGETTVMRFK